MKEKEDSCTRELYFSEAFIDFYNRLPEKSKLKFDYTMDIIRTEYVINTKFVKHLQNTNLYEMHVSISSNEYRTILFSVDNENIILSTKVILLNVFLKKSSKDYAKQVKIAEQILNTLEYDTDR